MSSGNRRPRILHQAAHHICSAYSEIRGRDDKKVTPLNLFFKLLTFISLLSRLWSYTQNYMPAPMGTSAQGNGQIRRQTRAGAKWPDHSYHQHDRNSVKASSSHFQYHARAREGTSAACPAICFSNVFRDQN